MPRVRSIAVLLLPLALVLSACGTAASTTPVTFSPPTAAPSTEAPSVAPTEAPSVAPTTAPTTGPTEAPSGATIEASNVAGRGTVLVAGSNHMTLYIYTEDVKDSGTSECSATCLTVWPALTVPSGTTPTAGPGLSGQLGTIVRADDGTTQVTYNGLPLYFFSNDHAPGDSNGVYNEWEVVAP